MFKHGFPPEWSTLKKLIWLVGSGIAGASYIWKTVTGSLIHITDALASPMQKCEVSLEPIQDLHGQDAPYPAGGGVNKFDGTSWNTYLPLHLNVGDKVVAQCNVSADYTSSYFVVRTYDSNKTFLQSFTNNQGTTTRYNRLTITSEAEYIQVQTSTPERFSNVIVAVGDYTLPMAYSPYSNICPITGWTGCEVTRTGKNLLDITAYEEEHGYYTADGEFYGNGNYNLYSISVKPETTYTISGNFSGITTYWDINDNFISGINQGSGFSKSFTTPANCAFVKKSILISSIDGTQMLELGSTATSYEPYSGTTLSVTFPDGQTVYGGKYEFVGGSGESKMAVFTLTGGFFKHPTLTDAYYKNDAISNSAAGLCVSNMFKYKNTSFSGLQNGEFTVDTNYTRVAIRAEGFNTQDEFNNFLSANPLQIVVPLATSTEISLTPQPISTLIGENNIWSNTNADTTVIYKAQTE